MKFLLPLAQPFWFLGLGIIIPRLKCPFRKTALALDTEETLRRAGAGLHLLCTFAKYPTWVETHARVSLLHLIHNSLLEPSKEQAPTVIGLLSPQLQKGGRGLWDEARGDQHVRCEAAATREREEERQGH